MALDVTSSSLHSIHPVPDQKSSETALDVGSGSVVLVILSKIGLKY
jgi:ribosomal protein L11 methylase PrmA